MPRESQTRPAANTIRILIATDNHVGYAERDPVRGNDSYTSFNEIMELAKDRDVDMVFLGGDLFHDNKPSRKAMYQVMRSIRLNCLGEKPCELQVLGDQSIIFDDKTISHVNYEDPDINVAIPVFSIHGNHDDPTGEGHLCALDILQVSGLINYIGRIPANDDITVNPLLLQKGTTLLALYGLSNVRDERLFNTFREGKVKFRRPAERMDDWFNLLAVHQNHSVHAAGAYLPENFIQSFFDMVIWGHEHECVIDPVYNSEQGFYVVQPGSSVATSLSQGETVPKHVGILSITGKEFHLEKIRLKTVRPFVMRDIVLSEVPRFAKKAADTSKEAVIKYLREQVEECIEEANRQWYESQVEDSQDLTPPLPLIRIRVEYSGAFEVENPQRFSNRFVGKVANTTDVVLFYRKRKLATGVKRASATIIDEAEIGEEEETDEQIIRVEALVKEFLSAQTLSVLEENGLGQAIESYVDKDDKRALQDFIDDTLKEHVENLVKSNVDEKNLDEEISKLKDNLSAKIAERQKVKGNPSHTNGNDHDDLFAMPDRYEVRSVADEDGDPMDVETTTRQTSKRRIVHLSDDDNEPPAPKKPRTAARAKPSRPAAGTSRQSAEPPRAPPAPRKTPARAAASRARKAIESDGDEDEDEDVPDRNSVLQLSDESDDFVTPPPSTKGNTKKPPASKNLRQNTLNFSGSVAARRKR